MPSAAPSQPAAAASHFASKQDYHPPDASSLIYGAGSRRGGCDGDVDELGIGRLAPQEAGNRQLEMTREVRDQ